MVSPAAPTLRSEHSSAKWEKGSELFGISGVHATVLPSPACCRDRFFLRFNSA